VDYFKQTIIIEKIDWLIKIENGFLSEEFHEVVGEELDLIKFVRSIPGL